MPHDVTMPQLGMAQDAGRLTSWLKAPGDAVAKGDLLFEVETDKATMEVEAQADGFLTDVAAAEGEDVPVGQVIARISDTAEDAPAAPSKEVADDGDTDTDALPEGRPVTMPQLGMSQDTGRIVGWFKSPGDAVAADDLLFEVETDKATMEVPAGIAGYLAATLARTGEDVPVGSPVAIISKDVPERTSARSAGAGEARAPAREHDPAPAKASAPAAPKARPEPPSGGRILASPKARRLALEQGLDLKDLVAVGHPQPYHVRDLEVLKAPPRPAASPAAGSVAAPRSLRAEIAHDGFEDFAAWAAGTRGLSDADALLAGLAGAGLPGPAAVAIERRGAARTYAVPGGLALGRVEATEAEADLILRDLRGSPVRAVSMGAEAVPVLTLMSASGGLTITLECDAGAMDAAGAIALLSEFAGRMEQPLRHLL